MSDFGNAFKTARAAGKKEFTWKGKRFNTKTKEEVEGSAPKVRPTATTPSKVGSDKVGKFEISPTKAKAEAGTMAALREGNRAARKQREADRKARRAEAAKPKPAPAPKKPSRDFSEESKKKLRKKLGFE